MHDEPVVESAIDFLRGHTRGDLRFDEHFEKIRYVMSPVDGRLVTPAMVAMLRSADTALMVPEDREDDLLEVMVTLEEFDEHGEHGPLADRWRIYHGEPKDVRWALITIDAARFGGMFIDGEAFAETNPLADAEAAICREMNRDRVDRLRELCAKRGGMSVEQPVMVGLDPRGVDVRAMFDIVRVRFEQPAKTAAEARRALGLS